MQHAPEMVGRMIDAVEGLIRRSIAPLAEQLRALDAWREQVGQVRGERGEKGEPGLAGRDGARGERGEKGEPGLAGRDGIGIRRLDLHAGGKAVDLVLDDGTVATLELPAGPAGADGRDGRDGTDGRDGARGEKGDRGEKGEPGSHGAPATQEMVDAAVDKLLPSLVATVSKRMESDLERLLPVIATRAAALVPPGRDGIPGRDGAPGRPGERGDDGRDGRDGIDGLGFDDMHVEPAGERALRFVFEREGQRKSFEIPLSTPLYEGTYQAGRSYQRNDVVTYASSMWIAKQATDEPPKGPGNHWRLVVKGGK